MEVVRVPTDVTAADRARWLGELSDALEEAQRLVWRMGMADRLHSDTLDLLARLESAHAEARSLRLGRVGAIMPPPDWASPAPWERCA